MGDERLELTATTILNDQKERIGTMSNWDLVTTKKNLEDSLQGTSASVAAAMEVLASSSNEMSATVNEISMNLQKANETTQKPWQ